MSMLKKTGVWGVGALVLAAPVGTAAQAVAAPVTSADTAVVAPGKGGFLHSGKLAVNRYVFELEHRDGKDYVNITFTGDHSADVQIMPDGMTPEGKKKVDQIGDVLKLNGYNDVHYWAVL
ncbi:hypothetical protein ACOJA0_06330 [Corynebacterium amycolatum]|uniref:hypothetical protein n=1 Tax=Corynebacterium amycolatum TaxID=43765 RepID=UPI003B5A3E7A